MANDPNRFDIWRPIPRDALDPLELTNGMPPPGFHAHADAAPAPPAPPPGYTTNLPVRYRPRPWRWIARGIGALIILFVIAVGWLAVTAPLSKSLEPPAPPSITLLSAQGTPIARRGANLGPPVDASKLPAHVRNAFIAIEDRRFYQHWGIDPRGIVRALVHNAVSGGGAQGGSTITQQLAKNAFLDSRRTAGRKFQEALIALWLEAWLTKDEILSRYLSNVYFGDNAYGLSAAAKHYFSRKPENLTLSQATLLAGLVQAPSRLAPTGNLKGARERQKLVIHAMQQAGMLTPAEARAVKPAVLKVDHVDDLPNGTYFADWVLPQARDRAGEIASEQTVQTTLDDHIQRAAERAVRGAGLRQAQIALVAMRPDGRVVAMVGGRNYKQSPFNRATQARRQPGSTFKLFVYLAALRAGMNPDTMIDDTPVRIGNWQPSNSDGRYEGPITLRHAFAKSSNVAAARITQQVGVRNVERAARDLGISTPIGDEATIALGTSTVSLLELTAAYASVAEGAYPVRPQGLAGQDQGSDWIGRALGGPRSYPSRELSELRDLLGTVVEEGTGHAARLSIDSFGKTGTTQDNRDALFVGYAGGLVAGVWIGNDDNTPNAGLSGGGLPARVWRDFMQRALDLPPPARPTPEPEATDADAIGNFSLDLDGVINGIDLHIGQDGVHIGPSDHPAPPPPPEPVPVEDRQRPPHQP